MVGLSHERVRCLEVAAAGGRRDDSYATIWCRVGDRQSHGRSGSMCAVVTSTSNQTPARLSGARRGRAIGVGLAVLALLSSGVWLLIGHQGSRNPVRRAGTRPPIATGVSLAGAPRLGAEDAPFAIVFFGGFTCDGCGSFIQETLPAIVAKYVDRGILQVRFRYLPNASTPSESKLAQCLVEQDQFWPVYQATFRDRTLLSRLMDGRPIPTVLHDREGFRRCMGASGATDDSDVVAEAQRLGVPKAPGGLIGWQSRQLMEVRAVFNGPIPLQDLERTFSALGVR